MNNYYKEEPRRSMRELTVKVNNLIVDYQKKYLERPRFVKLPEWAYSMIVHRLSIEDINMNFAYPCYFGLYVCYSKSVTFDEIEVF